MKRISKIKAARLITGMGQSELASLAGVCQSEISLFERGLIHLTPDRIEKISQVLGIKPEDIEIMEKK